MKITRRQLRRLIRETLIVEQVSKADVDATIRDMLIKVNKQINSDIRSEEIQGLPQGEEMPVGVNFSFDEPYSIEITGNEVMSAAVRGYVDELHGFISEPYKPSPSWASGFDSDRYVEVIKGASEIYPQGYSFKLSYGPISYEREEIDFDL